MSVKIYVDEQYVASLNAAIAAADDAMRDLTKLGGVYLDNAVVAVDVKSAAYGIFDADGNFITESLKYRGDRHQVVPKYKKIKNPPYMDVDAVYLGNIYPHFGHFMLEHMDRAWAYVRAKNPDLHVVFINNRGMDVPAYVYEFMKMLGVPKSHVIVLDKSARFRHLIVPPQSFFMKRRAYPEFSIGFRAMADNVKNPAHVYDKIYMSRAKLPVGKKTHGEEYVQKIFEKNGFHVVYPETMSLTDQVAIVKNARVMAGCAGTALHLALFMRNGGTVIQLKRNTRPGDSSYDQYVLNTVSGHDSVFVSASIEPHPSRHSDAIPQIIGVTDSLRRFFDDNGYKYTARDVTTPAAAWDEYNDALGEFRRTHGGFFYKKFKHFFIKIAAGLVPGRVNRRNLRHWLKEHM